MCRKLSNTLPQVLSADEISGIAVATGLTLMGASGSLNTGSISRFSIGLDEKQSYEESLHGPRDKIHHFADKHTGNTNDRVVESILWLIKRVSQRGSTRHKFPLSHISSYAKLRNI